MDAQTFLSRLAMLLAGNPPTPPDPAIEAKLKQLGIVPGQAFEIGKLDAASQAAVQEGVKSAKDAIATAARGSLGDLRNGWTIHWDLGRYGTNYGLRAVMASLNLGANAPEDALFASTRFDGGGRPLNGANRYVLRFPKNGKAPTDAFWSLSMYDDKHRFVGNPLGRHNIGDRDKPQENADGSMEIYIQHDNPGKDKESNWLPAPKGDFNLMMRVYWPRQEMLDRRWTPPAVARAQ